MGNPVTLSELEKALDLLIAEDAPPLLEDTDLTANRVAERARCGFQKASRLLDKWTADGKAEYLGMRRLVNGHKVKAWRLVTQGSKLATCGECGHEGITGKVCPNCSARRGG
jgi:ribosomal protein L32